MKADDLVAALCLPAEARVDKRVPKKLLLENGAPTAADRRRINEGIEEIWWVAALKPTTIGVGAYRDAVREYLEIALLTMTLRPKAKAPRLTELVHRAVPYPLLLLTAQGPSLALSLAHKRWSQGEAEKTVLDGDGVEASIDGNLGSGILAAFREALALERQPRGSLFGLYQGWLDTALALEAARVTGAFALVASAEHATARREALAECARLEVQIARLRKAAAKEKQVPRQVEMNLELKGLEAEYEAARSRL